MPKPGKKTDNPTNFCPIIRLNLNTKLYAKPHFFIHPDQVGFVIGRQTFDDIRSIDLFLMGRTPSHTLFVDLIRFWKSIW